jgi:PIN domain nuclease of toxin-antitoxin system
VILLDTQVLLWFVAGSSQLGPQAREIVAKAVGSGEAVMSVISLWEIGLLVEKKRYQLDEAVTEWIARIRAGGVSFRPVTIETALVALQAPEGLHGDPGDRLIAATAREHALPLVTSDGKLLAYAAAGHLQAIDARL